MGITIHYRGSWRKPLKRLMCEVSEMYPRLKSWGIP